MRQFLKNLRELVEEKWKERYRPVVMMNTNGDKWPVIGTEGLCGTSGGGRCI